MLPVKLPVNSRLLVKFLEKSKVNLYEFSTVQGVTTPNQGSTA